MKETRAYNFLKRAHPDAHWVRIESSTSNGAPDINACKNGREVWIEQKQIKMPKKKDTKIKPNIRASQVIWGVQRRRAGGYHYYAIMIGSVFYLINGKYTALLLEGVTLEHLKNLHFDVEHLFS